MQQTAQHTVSSSAVYIEGATKITDSLILELFIFVYLFKGELIKKKNTPQTHNSH